MFVASVRWDSGNCIRGVPFFTHYSPMFGCHDYDSDKYIVETGGFNMIPTRMGLEKSTKKHERRVQLDEE